MKTKGLIKKAAALVLGITMAMSALMLPCIEVSNTYAEDTSYTYSVNSCTFEYIIEELKGEEIAVITNVPKHGENVNIPSYIKHNGKEYPVVKIKDHFLVTDKDVKTIIFPETVKIIQASALYGSTVESITLPNGLEELGNGFASRCLDLRTINYSGTSITKMGLRVLDSSGISKYYDDDPFNGKLKYHLYNEKGALCLGNWLIDYTPSDDVRSVKIADLGDNGIKVENVAGAAFARLNYIRSVDLEGIKIINEDNFFSCFELSEVINDDEVIEVGERAFKTTKWMSNAMEEEGFGRIGNSLLYYITDSDTIDFTSDKFEGIKYIKSGSLVNCADTENIICSSDQVFEHDCLYVAHKQNEEGKNDSLPLISTYKIKSVVIDGEELTYQKIIEDPTAHAWLKKHTDVFKNSELIKIMVEEKTKALFEQMEIPYYGMNNDAETLYTTSEEFYIRLKIHNYVSQYDYDAEGEFSNGAISFLLGGRMICDTYAVIIQYMLECAGIESKTLNSYNHCWNSTRIGSEWFECDDGWDAQNNAHNFSWFGQSTTRLAERHAVAYDYIGAYDSFHMVMNYKYMTERVPAERTLGDIDGNNDRNNTDAQLLWSYLKGETDEIIAQAADINFDGEIDVTDGVLLENLVNGQAIDPDNIPDDGLAPRVKIAFVNGDDFDDIKYDYTDREGYITLPDKMFTAPKGKILSYDIGSVGDVFRITTPLTVIHTVWIDDPNPESSDPDSSDADSSDTDSSGSNSSSPDINEYELGDVNGDGSIDIEDAVAIIQHINGMTPLTPDEEARADVSKDENIDIDDAVILINYINGNSTF